MITLDVSNGAVGNKREHDPVIVKTPWGLMDQTPGYIRGWLKPRYPVPALSYEVEINRRTVYLWVRTTDDMDRIADCWSCVSVAV